MKKEKRVRGKAVHYDEVKERRTIMLTPVAWKKAKELAKEEKMSVSVYIEELIRKQNESDATSKWIEFLKTREDKTTDIGMNPKLIVSRQLLVRDEKTLLWAETQELGGHQQKIN